MNNQLFTYTANIEGRWYAFGFMPEKHEVCSICSDSPKVKNGSGRWYSKAKPEGVKAIASPSSSQSNAVEKAKRGGIYQGVFTFYRKEC